MVVVNENYRHAIPTAATDAVQGVRFGSGQLTVPARDERRGRGRGFGNMELPCRPQQGDGKPSPSRLSCTTGSGGMKEGSPMPFVLFIAGAIEIG